MNSGSRKPLESELTKSNDGVIGMINNKKIRTIKSKATPRSKVKSIDQSNATSQDLNHTLGVEGIKVEHSPVIHSR